MTATKPPALQFDTTNRVLTEERVFAPPPEVVEQANITAYMRQKGFSSYEELHRWSVEHNEEFWAEMAQQLDWFQPFDQVLAWDPNVPKVEWFTGGKTNIVHNALDRHMTTSVRNRVAFYWEGEDGSRRTVSYADLYHEVNCFARALRNLGLQKGDRVIIYLPRIPEQIVAMLAAARIGVVHSVVYSGLSAQALRDRAQDAQAKAIITADGFFFRGKVVPLKNIVDAAVRESPTVTKVITVRRAGNEVAWHRGRDLWYQDLVDLTPAGAIPCEELDSEAWLYMLYTSGSTGKPKGIVHVHGGYQVGIAATMRFVFDIKPDDVYWCTADPGWVTGHSYIVYGPLINGVTSLFYEGAPDYPDPGRLWRMVERYGVTILYTAPTAIRALMRLGDGWPESADLSSLRLLGTVGEPINPEAWMWYRKIGGEKPIVDTWWQTETGAQMITPTPIMPLKPGSATKPFLGIDAAVVDKDGVEVGADQGGYLVIRKPWPSMMRTIFGDPERYATYWNTIPGLYFAGDAAHVDQDGYFWIQGRVDDVISKSGYRLGSSEIESALVSHPSVAEAAVIGKPHEVTGESIKAFVILKSGYDGSDKLVNELRQHVRETVGPIAQPDEISVVPGLPKTRSGKIMRRLLKAQELGLDTGDLSTLEE
jgi:acetyl-CoA synthetase